MRGGFSMRLAQKFVKVNEIVTRERVGGVPVECRGTNIICGEKHNCQDKFNYMQCGKPHVPELRVFLLTARWYGELPSVSGLACVFAQSR